MTTWVFAVVDAQTPSVDRRTRARGGLASLAVGMLEGVAVVLALKGLGR